MLSTFIDSNAFIAFANKRDVNHDRALELLGMVRKGELGRPYTSDYVYDEVVTTALVRTGRLDLATNAGKLIIGSEEESILPLARLIKVDETIFTEALSTFKSGRHTGLSFTDNTILAHMKELKIDYLISFDSGFDGLAEKIK